ncbi:hypothetical protein Tco_0249388, partial [Tanacetum coccineum]
CTSISSDLKSSELKNGGDKPKEITGSKTNKEPIDDADKDFIDELAKFQLQEQEARDAADLLERTLRSYFFRKQLLTLAVLPELILDIYRVPNTGIFTSASYDDEGAVADFTNLDSTVNVSPIPTKRIHSVPRVFKSRLITISV